MVGATLVGVWEGGGGGASEGAGDRCDKANEPTGGRPTATRHSGQSDLFGRHFGKQTFDCNGDR